MAKKPKGKGDYRIPAKCRVCGNAFMSRYNVGKRARACTPPSHECKLGEKNGRKVSCVEGCCRSRYYRGAMSAAAGTSIDTRKLLTESEYKKTLVASKKLEPLYGVTIRFILATGCRLGEALVVRKEHIDWRDSPLSIVRIPTLKKVGHPELPVLFESKGEFAKELRRWADKFKPADELFPVSRRTLQRVFERILDRIKPDRTSLIHILRHTRASQLVKAGLPPAVIREQMRWSSIELLRVYSHSTEDEVAKALGRIP